MTNIATKVAHVKSQGQMRNHHCHWPGCDKQVPPAMWGCRPHWYSLPAGLRARIWAAYEPGQERSGRPSERYVDVAREAQQWIAEKEGKTMSKGYQEVRFCVDGRWQPTGQLRDQLPQELRPGDNPDAPSPTIVNGIDTDNVTRRVMLPAGVELAINVLGWAQFSRKGRDLAVD